MTAIHTERLSIPNGRGQMLAARLDRPAAGPPHAVALFAHCFTCSKDSHAARRIAQALAARGIATLRLDFTGLGESEGDFADTHFGSNLQDLGAAIGFLRDRGEAPALLIGHSLGGAAVIAIARAALEVRAVVTIGAPHDPAQLVRHLGDRAAEIEARGEAEVMLGGRPFTVRRTFLEDIAAHRLDGHLAHLGRALLVMHAPTDQVVGIDNATRLFMAARHPKSFVGLEGADHLLTRAEDAAWVADVIAAWSARFLAAALAQDSDTAPAPALPHGQVRVSETGRSPYEAAILAGPHRLIADEPESVGGRDAGPAPYDLLLAALGACTTMTLRMYAQRKGIRLERASVALTHGRVHAKDCAECEGEGPMLEVIDKVLTLEGDLSEAERARLVEIAGRCPVHRTLQARPTIRTRLEGDGPA
ncbi:MAG: alpha/beta fold hydrolase [Sphingomonadaceae bacterium]